MDKGTCSPSMNMDIYESRHDYLIFIIYIFLINRLINTFYSSIFNFQISFFITLWSIDSFRIQIHNISSYLKYQYSLLASIKSSNTNLAFSGSTMVLFKVSASKAF